MDNKKRVIQIIVLLVILVLIFILILRQVIKPSSQISPQPSIIPTQKLKPHVVAGSLTLKTSNGLNRRSQATPITVDVLANSGGYDLVGYDLIIKHTGFKLIKAESGVADFQIFTRPLSDQLIITGIKKLSSQSPQVFTEAKLLRLTFQPAAKGSYSVGIQTQSGKETTKFVDNKTSVYYPKTNSLPLEIY